MKRKRIVIIAAVVVLFLTIAVYWAGTGPDPEAPRFVAGAPGSLSNYVRTDYNWLADVPFEGGKVWMWARTASNFHSFLFDIDQQVILGELFSAAAPELQSRDGSRIFCRGMDSPGTYFQQTVRKKIDSLFKTVGWKLPDPKRVETFWILDIRNNRASRIGSLSQHPGSGSRWHSSPNFRYGYTRPSTDFGSLFICDLEAATLERVSPSGDPKGWWDDQTILVQSAPNTFNLFDIKSRKTTVLFDSSFVTASLTRLGLTNDPSGLGTFSVWNGRDYDFYFAINESIAGLKRSDSYLLKVERAGPALVLLYPDFQFRWSGKLDPTATFYVFQGESGTPGAGGDGSVYVRNLTNNTITTLVPPDHKGQYTIPRLHRDEVVYFRERKLRRIRLDGSNDAPLLPEPKP